MEVRGLKYLIENFGRFIKKVKEVCNLFKRFSAIIPMHLKCLFSAAAPRAGLRGWEESFGARLRIMVYIL
jgi:hypothetical protein